MRDVAVVLKEECLDVSDGDVGETDIPIRDFFQVHVIVPSWMNFLPASVRFLYSVHWRRDLLNCRSMATIWGPVLFGGMMGAAPGRGGGVGEGWCVNGLGSSVFCWGEYGAQVAMCTTAEGAGYSGEVVFQRHFILLSIS